MALTNPFPFDWLHSRSSDRWRKWSTILARTGGSGIPGRHGTTGAWGEADVTLYYTINASGERRAVLGEETATASNDTETAVPPDVDVILWEEGGDLMVMGWVCP
jgi:hypothetical protein